MAITILDLRPKMNAQANMMMGGGYESTRHYKNTVREFHPIVCVLSFLRLMKLQDNIHKVRDAWKKLHSLCCKTRYTNSDSDKKKWEEYLNQTEWFDYIRYASYIVYA